MKFSWEAGPLAKSLMTNPDGWSLGTTVYPPHKGKYSHSDDARVVWVAIEQYSSRNGGLILIVMTNNQSVSNRLMTKFIADKMQQRLGLHKDCMQIDYIVHQSIMEKIFAAERPKQS